MLFGVMYSLGIVLSDRRMKPLLGMRFWLLVNIRMLRIIRDDAFEIRSLSVPKPDYTKGPLHLDRTS